jgi:hypothetical protein
MVPTEVPPYFCTMSAMAPAHLHVWMFNLDGFAKSPSAASRFTPTVEFSLREKTAKPMQQGETLQRTSLYASFRKTCPCGGRDCAVYLGDFL